MNSAVCFPTTIRAFLLTVAVTSLVSFSAGRAAAYGVYEAMIRGGADAPELFSDAFPTPAPFPSDIGLEALEGRLDPSNGDFADMYCLWIGGATEPHYDRAAYHRFTPEQFSVTTVAPEGADHTPRIPDPQLFLFDAMGHPVVGNDDTAAGNFESTIPLGTITQSGVYILAVTGSGYNPTDADMNELFTNNATGLKTPTNANAVQAGWTGTHNQDGWYRLKFGVGEGHDLPPDGTRIPGAEHWVPEPNSSVLLILALSALVLRRRSA